MLKTTLTALVSLACTPAFALSNSSNSLKNIAEIGSSWGFEGAVIEEMLEPNDKIIQITATNNLSAEKDFSDEERDATYTLQSAKGCVLRVKVVLHRQDATNLDEDREVQITHASKKCKIK